GQNQSFTWTVSDAGSGVGAVTVSITRNGAEIFSSTDAAGSFVFNSYGLGTFAITVNATDADNDRPGDSLSSSASRTVVVSDDDITPPVIVLGGSAGAQTDGQDQLFTWDVSDAGSGLGSVGVSVSKDGVTFFTSAAPTGSFDFNSYGLGAFAINVTATDADNDRAGDSLTSSDSRGVVVTDDDTTAPTISLGGSSGTEGHALSQAFNWSISDASGLGAVSVGVTRDGALIYSSASANGNFNFDSYDIGTFVISVSATDGDNDRAGDSMSASSSRQVVVTNAAPVANANGTPSLYQGYTASFDAGASVDPDGDALNYQWDFGYGTVGAGVAPVHQYMDMGSFTIVVTVADPFGAKSTA